MLPACVIGLGDRPGECPHAQNEPLAFSHRDGATRVELKTWLAPPPAPFKGVFYKKVLPAWQSCWEQAVANIAAPSQV